ncbi:CoA transferase [Nocardia harenae]|uniref:CoA transferase n=1 Tax=Nocardia harenae TaxID=358707 RepID=UPI000830F489|nr:CoA transferase [Nocardia harenae]
MTARAEGAAALAEAGGPALTRWFTDRLWSEIGGGAPLPGAVTVTGDGDLGTPFPLLDLAAASFAVTGAAVAELLRAAGHDAPAVAVDRLSAGTWFDVPLAPTRYADAPEPHGVHSGWMAEFRTADARWIRVQASFPTLRRRLCAALGVREDPDEIGRALGELAAEDAERRITAAGAAAAVGRSLAEWRHSPQGSAVAWEPFAAGRTTLTRTARWTPHPERPLLGVRVLDMTRIVAGPMATRMLAALGAEVLRIDPPDGDEVAMMGPTDICLGKRWALLDARTPEGRQRYRELLASADVLVHGYRPGAVDGLGFDEQARAEISPGLVEVTLDAFGWTGPLRGRRGFDTIVQFASGLADEFARWGSADPGRLPLNSLGHRVDGSRPRILPIEILDFATGYAMAAAAIAGLRRQLTEGTGSITKLSLARTAGLLTEPRFTPAAGFVELPFAAAERPRVREMNRRPSRRLEFPVRLEGVELFWDRPAENPGSSAARWATTRPDR